MILILGTSATLTRETIHVFYVSRMFNCLILELDQTRTLQLVFHIKKTFTGTVIQTYDRGISFLPNSNSHLSYDQFVLLVATSQYSEGPSFAQ